MELDPRIEIFVDAVLAKANNANMEVTVNNTFDDDRESLSVLVHNVDTNNVGIIATEVREYANTEPIIFLIFNGKLYDYCKAEGFDRDSMIANFEGQVLKKVEQKQFLEHILNESDK